MTRVRWVTWWPAPYWVPRFERLAALPDVDFEAVFLAERNTYHEWHVAPEEWRFDYRILRSRGEGRGYYRHSHSPSNVLALCRGARSDDLVMPYADPTFLMASALARARRQRYHLFVANTRLEVRRQSRLNETLKHLVFGGASSCLATGPLQVEYAQDYVREPRRVHEIGNPVVAATRADNGLREKARAHRRWDDDFIVLSVGRLAPEKDLPTLLAAARGLAGHGVGVRLVLVGSGPLEEELRAEAARLGIRVEFPGFLHGAALTESYAGADVFVLPSLSESWGLVVNEAMEHALPTVVSDRVGAKHLLAGGAGVVFPAGEPRALESALFQLARDPERRRRFGEQARERIRSETIERWANAVVCAVRGQR